MFCSHCLKRASSLGGANKTTLPHGLNPRYPALQLGTKQQRFGILIVLKANKKSVNNELW
jgi:hypothetical protein